MIVYLETKSKFREDIQSNRIDTMVLGAFERKHRRSVGHSELVSWRNSLPFMERVLGDDEIPGDTGVAIEFSVPNTGKRIDFILTGTAQELRKRRSCRWDVHSFAHRPTSRGKSPITHRRTLSITRS